MKKAFYFVAFSIFSLNSLSSQDDKRDWTWLLGYPSNLPNEEFGGTRIDFSSGEPVVSFFNLNYPFYAISMINDPMGQIAWYTNGCHVINKENNIMENGSPINPGEYFDEFCSPGNVGYPAWQGVMGLPQPGSTEAYALIHLRGIFPDGLPSQSELTLTTIDGTENNGLGRVVLKNQPIGANHYGLHVTATRHGNGRDWWVVPNDYFGITYDAYLYQPDGFVGPVVTNLEEPNPYLSAGQISFSPDGSWFADCTGENQIRLSRFDRCSGLFFNQQKYVFPDDTVTIMGVAFSPSSKRLYVSTPTKIYQFDLEAPSVWASRQTVAEYDGFEFPSGLATTFFQAMLAPDDKIYLTATNSTKFLHIIHAPDSLGQACMVQQHGLELATFHAFMVPNFPYFRLYDLEGSPCDTLGINGPVSAGAVEKPQERLELFPVPAYDQINLRFSGNLEGAVCTIVDFTGKTVRTQTCTGVSDAMAYNLAGLPAGMYVMVIYTPDGKMISKAFQILH